MTQRTLAFTKVFVHLLCLLPLLYVLRAYRGGVLAAESDPVDWLTLLLAATSPQGVLRAMGGRKGRRLHWCI